MIVGLGIDIVDLRRIRHTYQRFGARFLNRLLAPEEIALLPPCPATHIGGRFAAKEAAVKALGTGFCHGISPLMILVANDAAGKPNLILCDNALARAKELGACKFHLSLSHERGYAAAIVILED